MLPKYKYYLSIQKKQILDKYLGRNQYGDFTPLLYEIFQRRQYEFNLSKEEFLHLFSEITPNPRLYAKFECPFTGKEKELLMYRGDRNSEEKWEKSIDNVIYKGVSLAIIQI